jgi:uncharacterized protein YraI
MRGLRSLRFALLLVLMSVLVFSVQAQSVRAVVVNEFANVRLTPALGATVIDTVGAGYAFEQITGRSGDNQWIRVIYGGQEGWVNLAPVRITEGDINSLPVADPRSIPYGGFEAPRAGRTDAVGAVQARATDGLRIRSGPSTAYPTLANINFNQRFTITGRTASTLWYQVSFEGTLGWVAGRFVEIISGDVFSTPVDGIVASAPPRLGTDTNDFIETIRLMIDRLNNAQPSLDTMRQYWTDAALNGRALCRTYPAQPSNLGLPSPLLAAYYATLDPLLTDFNDAMTNVRRSIELFIQICNLPGTGNPVGRATVEGALGIVNLADSQFASLRERLNGLLPPVGDGTQCTLSFNGKVELLPIITLGTIYLDKLSSRSYALGYCFDGLQGQVINLQALPLPNSQLSIFGSLSPLDTPSSFLAVNKVGLGGRLAIGSIVLPRTTRYLVILADLDGGPRGDFAFLVQDQQTLASTTFLAFDPQTQAIVLSADPTLTGVVAGGGGVVAVPTSTPSTPTTVCPSTGFTCNQLFTCAEAQACLAAGNFSLDPDGDGIPCEDNLCTGN